MVLNSVSVLPVKGTQILRFSSYDSAQDESPSVCCNHAFTWPEEEHLELRYPSCAHTDHTFAVSGV